MPLGRKQFTEDCQVLRYILRGIAGGDGRWTGTRFSTYWIDHGGKEYCLIINWTIPNVIAAISRNHKRWTIDYRPTSRYRGVLGSYTMPDDARPTRHKQNTSLKDFRPYMDHVPRGNSIKQKEMMNGMRTGIIHNIEVKTQGEIEKEWHAYEVQRHLEVALQVRPEVMCSCEYCVKFPFFKLRKGIGQDDTSEMIARVLAEMEEANNFLVGSIPWRDRVRRAADMINVPSLSVEEIERQLFANAPSSAHQLIPHMIVQITSIRNMERVCAHEQEYSISALHETLRWGS